METTPEKDKKENDKENIEKSMIPWFEWKTIDFGFLSLQVWGAFVALGMMLSLFLIRRRARVTKQNGDLLVDQAFWMIALGLLFSRIFHVVLYDPQFYLQYPLEIFKFWHGGLSSFGGLFGAVLGFFLFVKYKKIAYTEWVKSLDIFSFAALFGWIVGRIGCVFIHDHMGKPCDCFLAIDAPGGPRLEMSLLEILALLPLLILFFVARKKKKPVGWFTSWLFLYYAVTRFVLDFFRATDIVGADTRYLGLTPAQYSAILLFIVGLYLMKKQKGEFA